MYIAKFLGNNDNKEALGRNSIKYFKFPQTGNTPGEYKDFMFEGSSRVLENGSLVFERVAKDSEGHYLCEARNDIGAGLSKLIFLKVNGKCSFFILTYIQRQDFEGNN